VEISFEVKKRNEVKSINLQWPSARKEFLEMVKVVDREMERKNEKGITPK